MDDVSPQVFIDALTGYQKTAALKAAVALDLFTAIANEYCAKRRRDGEKGWAS